jgi:hypothetical protein
MGGRKIDDHSSWIGAAGKGHVFPDGPHKVKMESSAMSEGMVKDYQDTTEKIKKAQDAAAGKVRGHQGKLPEYRN